MNAKVRYGQSVKVTNPADRYENSNFTVGLEVEFPWADLPENNQDYKEWLQGLDKELKKWVDHLRSQVDDEIQQDVDTFIAQNTPGEE